RQCGMVKAIKELTTPRFSRAPQRRSLPVLEGTGSTSRIRPPRTDVKSSSATRTIYGELVEAPIGPGRVFLGGSTRSPWILLKIPSGMRSERRWVGQPPLRIESISRKCFPKEHYLPPVIVWLI